MAIKENCESSYIEYLVSTSMTAKFDQECKTIQNYCTINGQMASDNIPTIIDNLPSFSVGSPLNSIDFNSILSSFEQIYNFGSSSPVDNQIRTPDSSSFIQAIQNNKALLTQYNALLSILGKNVVTANFKISNASMEEIKNYIKNYEIDESRCFVCNTSKNSYSQSGGGGGCGDSSSGGGGGEGVCSCTCQSDYCGGLIEH